MVDGAAAVYHAVMLERRTAPNGVTFYASTLLEQIRVPHAFSTRLGGARLSAITAALSRPDPAPSAARAGRLREIKLFPAARALSTVTASIFSAISSSGMGRP